MKDNLISINLETATAPVVQEVRGRDYIEYGTDDWKNLYPQFLIDLYYNSSTHAAIINGTAEMIAGEDLIAVDEDVNLDAYVKLKKFMRHANSKESLHQVIKKVAFDFKLQGAYALHIVWNRERTEIAEIYHVPVERVRAGRPNVMGKVDTYYISADWSNVRTHKPYPIAAFDTNDRTAGSQLLYTGAYSPNMDIYHTPDYLAACNWALVDQKVAEFHLNNISNSFSGSYLFSFNNGTPSAEERRQIEQSLADKFTGSKAAGRFVLCFSDDRNRAPEITPLNTADLDKQYLALQELLVQNILTGHRVTSKTLLGIDSTNGFSSNTDELINAANFYQNTVVRSFQLNILDTLQTIFSVNNMDLPVEFVQLKPITVQFDSKTIREVMTQDEIREDIGLAPLDNNEETVEQEVKFAKVGMIDGEPVFSTIEEAEAHAITKGCKGYHEHELEGKTVYMACEGHEEATELSACIEEYGEDMPEGWEIINEEEAEEEAEDFDFQSELNSDYYEFASTGSAYPNRKSGQDQKSKQKQYEDDIYRVRYRYTGSLKGEREFCRKMTNANKLYRKEDIIAMGKRQVNPGWGAYGSNTYSIWKWKGGALCKHKWFRVILVQEGKRPKNSDKIISSTEARSRGVKLPRNAKEVSVAPHDMPNHGFVNPELIAKYKNVK